MDTPFTFSRTREEKLQTVIQKNTYYFFNSVFENEYESHVNSIRESLSLLKGNLSGAVSVDDHKAVFNEFLRDKDTGLKSLLALTGFSKESLLRIITLIRAVDDAELSRVSKKDLWCPKPDNPENIKEWSSEFVDQLVQEDDNFRKGLINLFFEGSTVPFLVKTIKPFELKKLSFGKMKFDVEAMLDTLVRYKEKGSYSGKKENNAEAMIETVLIEKGIQWEAGDLAQLVIKSPDTKRRIDFVIPNKANPKVFIECSYLMTTSSGQGDKSKTEINVSSLLKEQFPNSAFIGFVDGIGWYVRKKDLERMISAYEDVFTFHSDELKRFTVFLDNVLGKE